MAPQPLLTHLLVDLCPRLVDNAFKLLLTRTSALLAKPPRATAQTAMPTDAAPALSAAATRKSLFLAHPHSKHGVTTYAHHLAKHA
jgi:hypothetical protein